VTRLVPTSDSQTWDTWWDFSPDFLARFLEILGFEVTAVTFHRQSFLAHGGEHAIPFFTLVADCPVH
jgi:hypothetical protein